MTVFDDRRCELGEGALWHPERRQLFWFDIVGGALMSRGAEQPLRWDFGEFASAAGWIDHDHLLVATETGLLRLAIETGGRKPVAPLAADAPHLRSNDGRADPWGGFWIGLMGKKAEAGAGGIWRLWRGELRQLIPGITIPNAICFDAGRELAYFADTRLRRIWAQPLAPGTGWPSGEPWLHIDLERAGFAPDGAVVDAEGRLWNAQWGSGRVACYDAAGRFLSEQRFEASRVSCPAFGGDDLATLFVTTAQEGMSPAEREAEPGAGMTFARPVAARGLPEPPVVLG